MLSKDRLNACSIFIGFACLYIFTSAPGGLPAYRDAGEMVILLKTLGVAHPPGYPLFTVVGHLFQYFPWGTAAYKATLFSAVMGATALVLLYLVLRKWTSAFASSFAVILLGFSNPFWDLATVPEMYTMGIVGWALAMYGVFVLRRPLMGLFIIGLFLGVRMDMLLLVPLFFLFSFERFTIQAAMWRFGAFALGLTIFFYLLFRSRQNPWLDWGNPDTLATLFNSLSRKSYSGTLDLLSLSYRRGENFGSTIKFYGEELARTVAYVGLIPMMLGFPTLYRVDKKLFWFLTMSFVLSAPFFFFLANMPPNPHSLAIIEAAFILPTSILILTTAFGIESLAKSRVTQAIAFAFLTGPLCFGYQRSNKRDNWMLRDYVTNLKRSAPAQSIVIMHKDVQLFSLWSDQLVSGQRPDLSLISTGLSASPWYWEMKQRWPTASSPAIAVKTARGWEELVATARSRPVMAGFETEIPGGIALNMQPHGLLLRATTGGPNSSAGAILLREFLLHRTKAHYSETPDFFSTDLIGDTARAYQYQGHQSMVSGKIQEALWYLRKAQSMDLMSPSAFSDEVYVWFAQNDFSKAVEIGNLALDIHQRYLQASLTYKSLPDVANNITTEYANTAVIVGAAQEKVGNKLVARELYERAIRIRENAQAHYNLAVTYWNEDWARVVEHMQRAAELDPQMPNVVQFLERARGHLK